ncbi:NADP-dependent oxidoreductase domain-containing protein [Aspergillus crustosus]
MPAKLPTRPLGRNGPEIPALGFGMMGLSGKAFEPCSNSMSSHLTPGGREIRNDPDYIRMAVEESLCRLKTDYIDLLYCYGRTPVEEIVSTMKEFVDAGKVRYLGECGTDTLRRASAIHPIHAYQIEYSPFSMEIESAETNLLKTCRELGIAMVAHVEHLQQRVHDLEQQLELAKNAGIINTDLSVQPRPRRAWDGIHTRTAHSSKAQWYRP